MLVVADSSPLIVLVNIEHVDVLPKLFGQVSSHNFIHRPHNPDFPIAARCPEILRAY